MMRYFLTLCLAGGLFAGCGPGGGPAGRQNDSAMKTENRLFVGAYTKKEGHVDGKAEGLYLLGLDYGQPAFERLFTATDIINPSFVALSPDGRYIYAVSETGPEVDTVGYVYSYARHGDSLQFINRQPSWSFAPCHISLHPSGRFAFVANYVGGTIAMYPIQPDGGLGAASEVIRLEGSGPHPRQESSHPHSAFLSPNGRFAYVPDLGTDKVMIYRVDTLAGKLLPEGFAPVAPQAGPRHLAFAADGRFAYVINELNNTVTAFRADPESGRLDSLQTLSTLPDGFNGESYCADIHISPDGRFLYGSNRGHNSLAAFAIDTQSGRLALIGHEPTRGDFPRSFALTPDGAYAYVANQNSSNITIFKIKPDGMPEYVGEMNAPTPVCLVFALPYD